MLSLCGGVNEDASMSAEEEEEEEKDEKDDEEKEEEEEEEEEDDEFNFTAGKLASAIATRQNE